MSVWFPKQPKSPITEHRTSSDWPFPITPLQVSLLFPASSRLVCWQKQQETYPQPEGLGKRHFKWWLPPRAISNHNIIASMLTLSNWAPGAVFQLTWEVSPTLPVPPNITKLRVLLPSEVTLHVPIARVLVQHWVFVAPQTTLHWHLMDLPVDNEPIGKWAHVAILCLPASHNPRPGSKVGTRDHQSQRHEHPREGILAPDNKASRIIWAHAV